MKFYFKRCIHSLIRNWIFMVLYSFFVEILSSIIRRPRKWKCYDNCFQIYLTYLAPLNVSKKMLDIKATFSQISGKSENRKDNFEGSPLVIATYASNIPGFVLGCFRLISDIHPSIIYQYIIISFKKGRVIEFIKLMITKNLRLWLKELLKNSLTGFFGCLERKWFSVAWVFGCLGFLFGIWCTCWFVYIRKYRPENIGKI